MNLIETAYLNLLREVLENGDTRGDRTGVGTKSVFGRELRCNLQDGFPLLTTKKTAFKSILSELLWFIEGSGDERRLAEILHGSRDVKNKTIWTANAQAEYWKPHAQFSGDLGRVYGVQWRKWKSTKLLSAQDHLSHEKGSTTFFGAKVLVKEHDQLAKIVDTIKSNPTDRRMVLTALNIGEMDEMALPPCHMSSQFYVSNGKLSCQMSQRSADLFLGIPFDIASYALLTHMIAHSTGLDVGELIINIGDAHIYLNHIDQVSEQLQRKAFPLPTLEITKPQHSSIDEYAMSDFAIHNYESHPSIKAPMAV